MNTPGREALVARLREITRERQQRQEMETLLTKVALAHARAMHTQPRGRLRAWIRIPLNFLRGLFYQW